MCLTSEKSHRKGLSAGYAFSLTRSLHPVPQPEISLTDIKKRVIRDLL